MEHRHEKEMATVRSQKEEPTSYIKLLSKDIIDQIEKRRKATDEKRLEEILKAKQEQ